MDEYEKARITGGGCVDRGLNKPYQSVCCKKGPGQENKGAAETAPVDPEGTHARLVAEAECQRQGKAYDPATGHCISPCPEGQIRHKGKCEEVGVLPGSTTGKKGGFIQMKPTCAAGTTYSESENACITTPTSEEQTSDDGEHKHKKKHKGKHPQAEGDDQEHYNDGGGEQEHY